MIHFLEIVTYTCIAFFVGFYLFYFVLCSIFYLRVKRRNVSFNLIINDYPKVSVIIPTYNEATVIPTKIKNLQELNYPKDKFEVVFVDGGSTDGTADLIEELAKESELSVKIVRQGVRKGFNNAVIEGFAQTSGDIICITGAETEYDLKALKVMVAEFNDPRIGAVTGKQKIKNILEGFSPKLEGAYRSLYDFIREAESSMDSPFDIKGEISAARRDVVAKLVKNSYLSQKGCIDCCISFQARMDGYKTVYVPEATYSEHSPKTIKESFKQQIRRAVTLMENMLAFKNMIFNKKFGTFGMLIMPAHLLMLNILPFILLIGSVGLILLAVLNPSNYLVLAFICLILLATVLSKHVQAFLKTQLVLIVATLKLLIGTETQRFEKISTTRLTY
jgi:cellulose synthase/poly-beta-1,6-N-acetylglucosamine synthase-like glycosyltransferase